MERGHADGSIRAAVNATDIIVFSALITQPLPHGPDWRRVAERQIAIFMNGLAGTGAVDIPGPAVSMEDIERAFALRALPGAPSHRRPRQASSKPGSEIPHGGKRS